MKTTEKLTARILWEKGLKPSYDRSWGGLFPRLNSEIQISSFFGIVGLIVAMVSIKQKAEILMIVVPGFIFVVLAIFGCFKVYKMGSWSKALINKVHVEGLINGFQKEIEEIKTPLIEIEKSLGEKLEEHKKLCLEIESIDSEQKQDDLIRLNEDLDKINEEILELQSIVAGEKDKLNPLEKEVEQLKLLFYGDGEKNVIKPSISI